ncbi:AF4/FMR2 family member 4-like isoform X2 [Homarus americanus]|uniref:AF4/FMR2 family member 4-like isoform X2 n=1 Tax=Homarus americanus TaxID=6706 RepID=UPI001C44B682|nr:AF4/FMR2 family member 4-like isoform X2 [Homarus americanus]XP_042204376.1 AF4/FMR2 family member 4-like isoform X2 [Homarus americanus]XP_042204377.1 AF4/FMR2 family member 4-like isoform X2 [Homarus americanus]XP_042204378.1 AF4/FMR2 family member 4-like isoform X2 [Homarus americanus]
MRDVDGALKHSKVMSSRERSAAKDRDRERLKQQAREIREFQVSSGLQERDPQPVVFDVVRRSPNVSIHDNNVERILGKYDNFARCGGSKINMVGVDQQPPTPKPLHDPDALKFPGPQVPGPGSSKSSQRSLPPPQSSPNGTTRPPKPLPSSIKPPHPPSNHAHTKNGEVKGNLKGGPGPGPGDGGGGRKSTLALAKASLPPIKVEGGAGAAVDKTIQQIMSEMTVKHPMSAIVHTPTHHQDHSFFSSMVGLKESKPARNSSHTSDRLGKGLEMSRSKQPKALEGSHVNDELILSEDSEDEEREGGATNTRPLLSTTQFGTPAGHLQSSLGGHTNSVPPLSPISPKTSEESSTSDDTSDDSDVSSDDEQPECSPKPEEGNSNAWKLDNFITQRKTNSPLSQGIAAAGSASGPRPESKPQMEVTPPTLPSKEKRDRRVSKLPSASNPCGRGTRASLELRGRVKPEKTGVYDDSSDEREPHPRRTPCISAELRQTPKHGKDHESRARQSKTKAASCSRLLCSDSDSDSEPGSPRKSGATQSSGSCNSAGKGIPKVSEKIPKTNVSQISREPNKKPPRKKSDSSKKDSHIGAKSENGKSKRERKSMEFVPSDIDTDSDSDSIIDVVNTSPDKLQSRVTPSSQCTPSRTPKGVPSPVKSVQASPHVSTMNVSATYKDNVKRSNGRGLSEAISSESLTSKSEDELHSPSGRGQSSSQKVDVARDKGALVNRAFSTSAKKDKGGRERDPLEKNKKGKNLSEKVSCNNKDTSEKSKRERSRGVSESSCVDNRLEVRPSASPVVNKLCKSPIVSAEPKVPIPQVQYENGVPKLTCTIPLSFIEKVPKSSVNGASYVCKTEVKEEVDKKKVLDNRTKEGKGKRKTCDPNTKASEDASKRKIITSIFGGVKRVDHESDDDKVKKEVKKEKNDSDEEYENNEVKSSSVSVKEEPEEASMGRPSSIRQRNVSASPMSSVSSDTSSSRQYRKKKRDRQTEKSPSSRDRKRPKSNSERQPPEYTSLVAGGSNSCDDCDLRRSRRDGSVESEQCASSRKRGHDSSLESIRSSSRNNNESGEKRNKKPKVSKSKDPGEAAVGSPSIRSASQRTADDSQHAWTQEKEDSWQLKYPQRLQHSQQSSQYPQKGYNGVSEDAGVNPEPEFGEDDAAAAVAAGSGSRSSHQRIYGKDKAEESGTTPSADSNGYASRPASEHESRVGSASYRSSGDQTKTSDSGGTDASSSAAQLDNSAPMVAPLAQRQSASSTTSSAAPATSALATARPPSEQSLLHGHYANSQERLYASYFERRLPEINRDYMGYLNMAKQLKHIADGETDRSMQAMKYLEAALYFILSGKAMETDNDTSASLTMYKDTLNFIKWVSSVFRRENQEGSINTKLAVISLRCQSLLSLKIYKMRRIEHKENQRQLNRYFQNYNKTGGVETAGSNGQQWGGQRATGSPSHLSQTPSPAGSVGSEGSQSSGYTTSTEGTRSKGGIAPPPVGHTPPHPQPPQGAHATVPVVPVPVNIHNLIIKQNQLSSHLASAHDMWIEADHYVFQNGMQDFFIELDRHVSPLTLHSSLYELVCYVQYGLHRLKD